MVDRSKMADQNQFFRITSEVVNIFPICCLLYIGVNKTQVLGEKNIKKSKMAAEKEKPYFSRHLEFLRVLRRVQNIGPDLIW
jgi:hypothetical protein